MKVVEIKPDGKYVLIFEQATEEEARKVLEKLAEFMSMKEPSFIAIFGDNVSIIQSDQVVGYKVLNES